MLLGVCGSDNKTSNSAAPASAAPVSAAPADTTGAATTAAPSDTSGSAATSAPSDTTAPDDSAGLVGDKPATAGPRSGICTVQKNATGPNKLRNGTTSGPSNHFEAVPGVRKAYCLSANAHRGFNGRTIQTLE